MKKVLSIVLSLALVVGLSVGINAQSVKADSSIENCTPVNGATVDLLSDRVYNFCANYERGLVNSLYKKNSNKYYPTPVRFAWDVVSGATSYKLEISTVENLANPMEFSTVENMIEVEDLMAGYDYYYRVSTLVGGATISSPITHFKTTNLPRTIKVDGVGNTRDIGGCYVNDGKQRVLQGKVIRGANLDNIGDAGKTQLLNTFGIKTDLDLREENKVPSSSPLGNDIKFINISAPQYIGEPSSSNKEGGIDYEPSWPKVKSEVLTFADASNYPIYVHCAIGRDRTGTIMILIEALLGMTEDEIYRDYELSYFAQVSNSSIADPVQVNVNTIDKLIDYLKNYSSGTLQQNVEKYMKDDLGITDAEINSIKDNLLTPLPVDPTEAPTEAPTVKPTTKYKPLPTIKRPGKVKIKKIAKRKRSAKKMTITLSKVADAKGYQVVIFTRKIFAKRMSRALIKKYTTKTKFTIKSKKIRYKSLLFARARAYKVVDGGRMFGNWSNIKKSKAK